MDAPPAPPDGLELVSWETAATFTSAWEAELARARLEAEGIPAIVGDDHLGSLVTWNLVGGFKVRVPPEERERAVRVLAEQRPRPELFLVTDDSLACPRCPRCNSDNLTPERDWLLRPRFLCRSCGADLGPGELADAPPDDAGAAPPPDLPRDADLVPVARFHTPWEAHLARTRLEASGVRACVLEERLPPVDLWTGQPRALNRVAVRQGDAARAAEILADPQAGLADDEENPAEAGS